MSSLSTKILGTVAIDPKGEYDSTVYYEKLNTVLYNDSTYMAIKPSHNILPTDTEYWQLIGGGLKKEDSILIFNTVADMKNANLKDGMSVQTLGYYEVNDGGEAKYKIRAKENSDTIDNSFIVALENSQLIAELIIENGVIYANKLGADSTGNNDASIIINRALEKINEYWLNNIKINTLVLNGIYKIDNKINMPPCAKLRSNGLVKIISNVANDSTIHIHYLNNTLPQNNETKQKYLSGELINFESGCIITSSLDKTTSNSIAIEIGDRTDLGFSYAISRYSIKNISINNFSIGLLHNSYNIYIGNYEHLHLEGNITNIQFGTLEQINTASNIGEKMNFENCIFASSSKAVNFGGIYWHTLFNNCSFDFNIDNFYQQTSNQYGNSVKVSNSHIENFTRIVKNFNINQEYVNICNSFIFNSSISVTPFEDSENALIVLDNTVYHTARPENNLLNPQNYLILSQQPRLENTKYLRVSVPEQWFIKNNLVNSFDNLEDGTIPITDDSYIGDFKVIGRQGIEATANVITDNYLYNGHKSIVFTRSSSTNKPSINLETDFIPITNEKLILNTLILYNMRNRQSRCLIEFFDKDKNSIQYKTTYEWIPETIQPNTWCIIPYGNYDSVPSKAKFYKLKVFIPNMMADGSDDVGTEYKLGIIVSNLR